MPAAADVWFVYMARCADGTLYTGIARDVAARIAAHDAGRGARYTRGRGPLTVCAVRRCRSKGEALRLELAVKRVSRTEKEKLSNARRLGAFARRLASASRLLVAIATMFGCESTLPTGTTSPPTAPGPSLSTALPPEPVSSAPVASPAASAPIIATSPAESSAPMESESPSSSPPPPRVCGRTRGQPIERAHWAHGQGNAHCDELETRWANVPHADRACKSDDECTVKVSDGNCILLPLTKNAAVRPEYQEAPCGNPMSGACVGRPIVARCASGCCVADSRGL